MKKLCLYVPVLFIATGIGPCFALESPRVITAQEAVFQAISNNPDVMAARLEPAAAEAVYRKASAIYNPQLSVQAGYSDQSSPSATRPIAEVSTQSASFEGAVSQLLPTGGVFSMGLSTVRNRIDPTSGLSRYWDTAASLTITQPLLKNLGIEPTELSIRVAGEAARGSLEQFRASLMDTVISAVDAYFGLMGTTEEVEVRKSSLALSQKILSDTKGRVAAGVLPAMEILNAEFGLATREKELIDVEKTLSDQHDVLSYLIQLKEPFTITSVSSIDDVDVMLDDIGAVSVALERRPEIRELLASLAGNELQERVARNRTLPDLSLAAGATLSGLSGASDRTAEQIANTDYPSWSVGIRLAYPLGNDDALNEHARIRVRVEQVRRQVDALKDKVANEVRSAVRAVVSSRKQQEVAERGRNYAEERFRAFQKKHDVGMATTKELLDVEQELAQAKSTQILAKTSLVVARYKLWRATGELLERCGIEIASNEGQRQLERFK